MARWSVSGFSNILRTSALIVSVGLVAGLLSFPGERADTAYATDSLTSSLTSCRGATAPAKDANGLFENTDIRIEPVHSKRMYIDPRNGFDATYIAYRVTNRANTTRPIWVEVSDFSGVVSLANPLDSVQRVGNLAKDASGFAYFFLTSNQASAVAQDHRVTIYEGHPSENVWLLRCRGGFESVQRSIAAKANKVTNIQAGAARIGDQLVITVDGVPGKVGAGNTDDGSVFALSPASHSSWPTRALRLEAVRTRVNDVKGNLATCRSTNSGTTPQGTRIVEFAGALALRKMGDCFTTTRQTYTITYTYRVIGGNSRNPAITPLASIASGTQVKYTGSLPAQESTVDLAEATVPVTVTKSLLSSHVNGDLIVAKYRIQASLPATPSASVSLDEFVDKLPAGATYVANPKPIFRDSTRTSNTFIDAIVTTGGDPSLTFRGPFSLTNTAPAYVDYEVSFPKPAEPTSYSNRAYGVIGSWIVGDSSNTISVVSSTVTSTDASGSTGSEPMPKIPQAISFRPPATGAEGSQLDLNGTADSGLSPAYVAGPENICIASEFDGQWTVTFVGPGDCVIRANQPGNDRYAPAEEVVRTIKVVPGQVITALDENGETPSGIIPSSGRVIDFTASSNLTVAVDNLTPDVCVMSSIVSPPVTTVTLTPRTGPGAETGQCVVVASQEGSAVESPLWAPAPELLLRLGVGFEQVIEFTTPAKDSVVDMKDISAVDGRKAVELSAVAMKASDNSASKLPVTFETLTPDVCDIILPPVLDNQGNPTGETLSGYSSTTFATTVSIRLISGGVCRVSGDQDGTDDAGNFTGGAAAAPTTTHTFTVKSDGAKPQTISVSGEPDEVQTYGSTITLEYTSFDGAPPTTTKTLLEVVVSSSESVCRLGHPRFSSGVVTILISFIDVGSCTLSGRQDGNSEYAAATEVTTTIHVGPKPLIVDGQVPDKVYDGTTSASVSGFTLGGIVPGDLPADIFVAGGTATWQSPNVVVDGNNTPIPHGVDVTGISLGGTKASRYTVEETITTTATITLRPITLAPRDQTLKDNEDPTSPCEIDIVSGSLASGAVNHDIVIASNNCSASGTAPDEILTLSTVTIQQTSMPTSTVTANYAVTLVTGKIIRDNRPVPDIAGDNIVITYGDMSLPGEVVDDGTNSRFGLRAQEKGNSNNRLVGKFTLRLGNQKLDELPEPLEVDTYTVLIEFTPDDADFAKQTVSKTLTVQKRNVSFTATHVTEKFYDASAALLVSWTINEPQGNDGVLAGDTDVRLASSSASVNITGGAAASSEPKTVSWGQMSLVGNRSGNYNLTGPTEGSILIKPRPITISAGERTRLTGQVDPDFGLARTGGTLAPGETNAQAFGTLSADILDQSGQPRESSDQVGAFTVVPQNSVSNSNYSITRQNGVLYVADLQIIVSGNVEDDGTILLDTRTVECNCSGLAPNSKVLFQIESTVTTILETTTDSDGNCPVGLSRPIQESVDDGPHTLYLRGNFPDSNGTSAEISRGVRLVTPSSGGGDTNIGGSTSGSSSPPAGSVPPGRTTPSTEPDLSVSLAPPATPPPGPNSFSRNLLAPITPPLNPAPLGPQATSEVAPGNGTNASGQNAQNGQSPLTSVVERSRSSQNTFDLGVEGVSPAELVSSGSSARAGTRTVNEMRQETIGGFNPGTALQVEVIGSRTTARFVVSTLTGLDELVLIEQISRSSAGNRLDFAGLDRVGLGSPTGPQNPWSVSERDSARDLFGFSRLDAPTKQSDLLGNNSYTWLNIEKGVRGYLPGSTIYLTATSSPVVFGEAQVGLNGEAIVTGDLAVELLGLGEHRLRVIGTRVFSDIQVDADGEVIIPDFVLDQILLFDMGTDATVIVTGNNPAGGVHTVMRVVPLDPVSPWWTLWVIGWTAFLLLIGRLRRMIRTFTEKSVASGAVLVSSIPAVWLGWTSTVTQVAWWGLLMGLILAAVLWFVPAFPNRRGRSGDDPSSGPEPEEPEPTSERELLTSRR